MELCTDGAGEYETWREGDIKYRRGSPPRKVGGDLGSSSEASDKLIKLLHSLGRLTLPRSEEKYFSIIYLFV
jgi:hypothetical protein